MGSPAIFNGKFTKLLTQNGILNSNGSINQNDGVRNYVAYSQFEQNNTTGWSLGTIGTLTNGLPTGSPTFGSGASGNLAISAQSTGALRGSYSLQYASSAATTAGNMLATDALAIDPADQAKILSFKFYYSVTANPSNGNFSGTSSNSFGVAVYDVTNSSFIAVQGAFGMTQSSGVGIASGTFQTNSNTASLRFIVYNVNASAGAITLLMDDFFVGPQQVNIGPVVTDWVTYSGKVYEGTTDRSSEFSEISTYWRRVGDSIEIQFNLARNASASAGAGGNAYVTFPTGPQIDTSNGNNNTANGIWFASGSNTIQGTFQTGGTSPSGAALAWFIVNVDTAPFAYNNTNFTPNSHFGGFMRFKMQGYSSNVQMSSDSYQGIVAAAANGNSNLAITANAAIPFTTVLFDTNGITTIANGRFTIPVSGYYTVSLNAYARTTGIGGTLIMYKNGAANTGILTLGVAASYFSGSSVFYFNAGDYFDIRSDASLTLLGGYQVSMQRISGPSVLAATETVAARYTNLSGQSFTSGTAAAVTGWVKSYDTNNAFNTSTGTYFVPVSGKYQINASFLWAGANVAPLTQYSIYIIQNGANQIELSSNFPTGSANTFVHLTGVSTIPCNAGDTIVIWAYQNSGGARTMANSGNFTYINFLRVGN